MSQLFWKWCKEKHCYGVVVEYVVKWAAYSLKRIDQFEQAREPAASQSDWSRSRPWTDKHFKYHGKRSGTTPGGKIQRS